MSGELKACAHCGGRGEMDQFSPDAMDEWRVICADKSCEAWGPEASTRDAAITAWNRRAPAWRPIAEAQTDMLGDDVLAWADGEYVICRWVKTKDFEGWTTGWETVAGYDVGYAPVNPTHFLPLPAAPAEGGK